MSKGIVTEYPEICIFCGRQAEAEHHLIFGTAGRELSEKDGLKIPVCNNCHNMGQKLCRIHENPWLRDYQKCLDRQFGKKSGFLPITSRNQEKPGKHSGRDTEDHICRRREYGSYIDAVVFIIRWSKKVR